MKALPLVCTIALLILLFSACVPLDPNAKTSASPDTTAANPESLTAEMQYVTHIDVDMAEQDVFLESDEDPSLVVRVSGKAAADPANRQKTIFASAVPTEHDPMALGKDPLGPFPKGESLGMTLEEWLAASGSGTYTLHGNQAEVSIDLQGLVPNGLYTVWCGRIGFSPTFVIVNAPCGPVDGSEATIEADAEGNATYELTMHALPASNDDYLADIAFAYHSDGKAYGLNPGEFGVHTHVHLFVRDPLPAPVALEPIVADINFVTHVDVEMPEQDVFIESAEDDGLVVRPLAEAADTTLRQQMIYAAAEETEHNPMMLDPDPLGPFSKGKALGMTLDAWLAANGTGTYMIEGSEVTIDVALENLVPNGVYSAWCGILTINDVFTAANFPCGSVDGSQSAFQADENGSATYRVTMPAMPASDETTFSDIAFAYHSDGQTCGPLPCEFGVNSHVQLFIEEPPPAPQDLPALP